MGKKGKKKGGKEAPGVPMNKDTEEHHMYCSMQVEALERELQVKSALAEEASRSELELRGKVDQMQADFEKEQSTTYAVTADMARQYKALQEELIYKINSLETQLTEQKEELVRDKDEEIDNKDDQIKQLNERMNEMSTEFANMLSETLDLMKQHISEKLSDNALGDADAARPDFTQRLEDFSKKAYNAVSVSTKQASGAAGDSHAKALTSGEAAAGSSGS
eukprot:TRINITY_DN496_c0_g1_i3.p1 TRINITY_DN496_c0_g1~~TRINITY_DN496_c0_g1_i3.p1  ORF type:complete len:221 (-),score=82.86 TRINITY_DN496_c0_g1_i3:131-793(-)